MIEATYGGFSITLPTDRDSKTSRLNSAVLMTLLAFNISGANTAILLALRSCALPRVKMRGSFRKASA